MIMNCDKAAHIEKPVLSLQVNALHKLLYRLFYYYTILLY